MSRPVISPRSWPAQNAGPAPSTTIARTLVSEPSCSSAAITSVISARLSALRWAGRLRVIRASGPSRRTSSGPAEVVSVVSSTLMPATIRPRLRQYEPELRAAAAAGAPDVHEQRAVEDAVRAVARLAGEVELRREDLAVGALHLDVDVARAPGIEAGHDRPQRVAPAGVGELVAAQAVAPVVVLAAGVPLPEVEQRAAHRPAPRVDDIARDEQRGAANAVDHEVRAPGRVRRVVRALGLGLGRVVVAVVAGRR